MNESRIDAVMRLQREAQESDRAHQRMIAQKQAEIRMRNLKVKLAIQQINFEVMAAVGMSMNPNIYSMPATKPKPWYCPIPRWLKL